MKILKTFLFAAMIGLSLSSTGCYVDDVASSEVVVYRSGVGYGYWYNSIWYPAPSGYVYVRGARPYWGSRYYRPAPRPYYRPYTPRYTPSPYRGGGWRHR